MAAALSPLRVGGGAAWVASPPEGKLRLKETKATHRHAWTFLTEFPAVTGGKYEWERCTCGTKRITRKVGGKVVERRWEKGKER